MPIKTKLNIGMVMNDLLIDAIHQNKIIQANLNFNILRQCAGIDSGKEVYESLNRGRLTIKNQYQLNQYLYSYGPMVFRQWTAIVPKAWDMLNDNEKQPVHIYDYGCGQGLATMLLLEKAVGISDFVRDVTLFEPSEIALARASAILKCKLPHANIHPFQKFLDNVEVGNVSNSQELMKVHLFSNVLDIPSFDPIALMRKVLKQGGSHYIIAVSNDRECYGGTPRLKSLYDKLLTCQKKSPGKYKISHANMDHFVDVKNKKSVYFFVKIEVVENGSF